MEIQKQKLIKTTFLKLLKQIKMETKNRTAKW